MVSFIESEPSLSGKELLSEIAKPGWNWSLAFNLCQKHDISIILRMCQIREVSQQDKRTQRERKLYWTREINEPIIFVDQLLYIGAMEI